MRKQNQNTLTSGLIQAVHKKNSWIARGFAQEYLRSCTGYGPGRSVKRRGKSCSLKSKKFFLVGECRFFVSDVISGVFFGHHGQFHLALGTNRYMIVFC